VSVRYGAAARWVTTSWLLTGQWGSRAARAWGDVADVAVGSTGGFHDRPLREPSDGFVAELLHDLRQPVSVILVLADLIASEETLFANVRRRARQIDEQIKWLAELIDDGLALAQPLPRRLPVVDMGAIVAKTVEAAALMYSGTIVVSGEPQAFTRGEPVLLRRAVGNVLDNAARATGPEGLVELRVQSRPRTVDVVVEDDGPGFGGIPTQHALGLHVTRRVVERYGGSLEVRSSSLGGARVRLSLRRVRGPSPAGNAPPWAGGHPTSQDRSSPLTDEISGGPDVPACD
jgi:signal transduction histidine kinase